MFTWEDVNEVKAVKDTHDNGLESLKTEQTNRVVLDYRSSAWQDFHTILVNNGYKVETEVIGDSIWFTWWGKE